MRQSLYLGFVLAIFGCTDLGDASQTRDTLRVGTYNAGLAYGFVKHAEQRAPELFEALPKTGLDILCVQEFWTSADWNKLSAAAFESNVWRNSYRRPPKPEADEPIMGDAAGLDASFDAARLDAAMMDSAADSALMDAAADGASMDAAVDASEPGVRCTAEEADPLETCARASCSDVSTDDLVDCVVKACGAEVGALGEACFGCVVGAIGNDLDTILDRCGPEGEGGTDGGYAYEGSFGTGILSNMPLRDPDALVLRSTTNRRAVLYAKFGGTAAGTVHFFCTHLTANLTQLPYTGPYDSWADEQAAQIDAMLAWIDEKAGTDGSVIVAGDFNSGPGMGDIRASLPENYAKYGQAGYDNPYAEQPNAKCTSCDDNPLGDDLAVATGSLIDHVFTRNISESDYEKSAERFLTEPLNLQVEGESVESAYSDHYGVKLELKRSH